MPLTTVLSSNETTCGQSSLFNRRDDGLSQHDTPFFPFLVALDLTLQYGNFSCRKNPTRKSAIILQRYGRRPTDPDLSVR